MLKICCFCEDTAEEKFLATDFRDQPLVDIVHIVDIVGTKKKERTKHARAETQRIE